ncbi:hypothetical protein OG895_38575 [Streptomyces sp. NBC_00201]|uniref:hypothetical protein n=1 Tax=unclassified Streptomyces TaxID=2593676 RepID=UPI00225C131D|nr:MULTISPECIES: hypothetical protein [unclassified Streptomyces]MCX5063199.1 hypothetical protein [Streptomyces sp. NBC_00452]MCX5251039.1 hypothetical protein [Streptomyces sp. NBC_00201]MCX5291032.1 hypothetical protein [Streptomyces sp. NBC_00183]
MTRLRRLLACLALVLTAGCSGAAGSSPAAPAPRTHESSPAAEPSSTRTSAQATVSPSDPGSPSGSGSPGSPRPHNSPRATTTAPREADFPNARTTGPRIRLTPHATGNLSIRTDGMVIKGWDITGSLDIYANNVTVIDSRITSTNWWGVNLRPGHSGLRVLHTTITAVPGKGPDNGGVDYAVSNMGTSSVEVGWCDVSVFGNALSMGQGHIHDNYVHDLVPFRNAGGEWQHTDAVISGGGNTGELIIRHNTLLNPVAVDRGASASIGLFADTGHVSSTVIDKNLLAGGAYALYGGGDGATGITVTDNVFSTRYHSNSGNYGAVTAWNTAGSGNVWRGNRFADGTPVTPEPAG